MSSSGGNWKDLFKAASEGDVELVRYHLDQNVDPNYQHPEYFSNPLHEATRNGHAECVRILIQQGKADPTIVEHLSDSTPLEIALEEKHHAVVDLLLPILPRKDQSPCKRILFVQTNNEGLVKTLLNMGHQLWLEQDTQIDIESLKKQTGNQKLKRISEGDLDIDVCVLRIASFQKKHEDEDSNMHDVRKMLEETRYGVPITSIPRIVLIFHPSTIQQTSLICSELPASTAILEPTSWWHQITYNWWCDRWYHATAWLATTEIENVYGKAYNYERVVLELPEPKPQDLELWRQTEEPSSSDSKL
mmetsp:Transcript_8253/g.11925  ORF Transcript_8253/g.11925 Transcript_8253/m.11925 type:complete len:304 (+) Transcript_8253:44-955(+)